MGAAASSSSAAAPAARAEASVDAPPQGCPMHQQAVKGTRFDTAVFGCFCLQCDDSLLSLRVASPPPECPMHQAPAGPAHQERAYEFVECPMSAAGRGQSDIDPTNMVPTGQHGGAAA